MSFIVTASMSSSVSTDGSSGMTIIITSATLARTLGVPDDISCIIRERRLRWLGDVARMEEPRLPKCVLFGELHGFRPRHGPKKRWRDLIVEDLAIIHPPVPLSGCFSAAQDHAEWRGIAHRRPSPATHP